MEKPLKLTVFFNKLNINTVRDAYLMIQVNISDFSVARDPKLSKTIIMVPRHLAIININNNEQ